MNWLYAITWAEKIDDQGKPSRTRRAYVRWNTIAMNRTINDCPRETLSAMPVDSQRLVVAGSVKQEKRSGPTDEDAVEQNAHF